MLAVTEVQPVAVLGGGGGGGGTGGASAAAPTAAQQQQQQQNAGDVGAHHVIHVEPSLFFAIDTSGSIPGEGSGAGSRTGEGEEPTSYALLGRGRISRGGGNDGKEASYSSLPSPLPPATVTSTISTEGTVAGATDNLGALVSFDLDSNLAYRLELGRRKLAIPEASAPVRKWLLGRFDARRVSSLFRVAGAAFRPFRAIRPVEPVHPTPPSAAVATKATTAAAAAAAAAAATATEADTHQSRRNAPVSITDDDADDTSGNTDSNSGTIDDAGMPPTWWCDDVSIVNNTGSDSRFPVCVVNHESLLTLPFFSISPFFLPGSPSCR